MLSQISYYTLVCFTSCIWLNQASHRNPTQTRTFEGTSTYVTVHYENKKLFFCSTWDYIHTYLTDEHLMISKKVKPYIHGVHFSTQSYEHPLTPLLYLVLEPKTLFHFLGFPYQVINLG